MSKGAIKKSTAQAICDAVKVKEGTTEGVPFKDVAERILALPTPSGENKLIVFIQGDSTLELTKEDLKDLQEPLRPYVFSGAIAKSIELPEQITTLPKYCFHSTTAETIKIYANNFNTDALRVLSTDTTTVNLYLFANDFIASSNTWFYNNVSKKFNMHFNNEEAFNNFLYAASMSASLYSGNIFQNIADHSVYYGETLVTEVNIHPKITTFGKTLLFAHTKGIKKIKFLGDIAYIPNYSFSECDDLLEIDFTASTTIPTLGGSDILYLSHKCKIKVPSALYNDWISATNWSGLASRIIAV